MQTDDFHTTVKDIIQDILEERDSSSSPREDSPREDSPMSLQRQDHHQTEIPTIPTVTATEEPVKVATDVPDVKP